MTEYKNPSESHDVFAKFDKLSDDFKKTSVYNMEKNGDAENLTPLQQRRKTRSERLAEQKSENRLNGFAQKLQTPVNGLLDRVSRITTGRKTKNSANAESGASGNNSGKKRRKYRINVKRLVTILLCLIVLSGAACAALVFSVLKDAKEIDPNNIYQLLSENSVMYDDAGAVLDSIYDSPDGERTNIAFADMPEDLYNAFIALEDKTFWEHKGFNIVRIFGAIKDSVFSGGRISGTSTITQQLARNIYLSDTRSLRTLNRKILEAYYSVLIEKYLTKEQIIEAYLNTIQLGFNTSGVQAASQAYFSKNVGDLTLIECAALAALPQKPTIYALVKTYANDEVAEGDEDIIRRGNTYTYVYNDKISQDRRNLTLKLMNEQGYIDEARCQEALADDIRAHIVPRQESAAEYSSYFTDYVIQQVLNDLVDELGYDMEEAQYALYNNGLRIHSTVNSSMQKIVETEFANAANFPKVVNLGRMRDAAGNIQGQNKEIILYKYSNYFDDAGNFTLNPSEYEKQPDGSLKVFTGNRLNFYRTEVGGNVDYSVEFKNMYVEADGTFYSINGGFISIPREYKDRDAEGNLIISAQFAEASPDFFTESDAGLTISNNSYVLRQQVIQPQSAMVITDHKTGFIKAMTGGRNTVGRRLYNRADNPRQPGSSIKPMAVYGPALQSGLDAANSGSTQFPTAEDGTDEPVTNIYGSYWTAASVIDDAPTTVEGRTWPKNWYNSYNGLFTMRHAVEQSVNVCAVKVFQEVGPEYSYQFLKKLGVTTVVDSGETNDMNPAALALGGMTKGISPIQMSGAYGAFANQGVYIEPIAYTKVTNKHGDTLLENTPVTTQAMDPGVAFIMTDILRSTVTSGIAGSASIGVQPVAGKTGTTTDNFDAWFVGLTPQYSAALWIGNDVNIELSTGSGSAARLWSKIMKQVCAGIPAGRFPSAPDNVVSATIDIKSGLLPADISSLDSRGTIRSEYFVKGTVPTTYDNIHTYVDICRESGYLATPLCTQTVSAFGVRRPYTPDPAVADIKYEVPHHYCFIHNPDTALYPINENALWSYNWEGQQITNEPPEPEVPETAETPGAYDTDGTNPYLPGTPSDTGTDGSGTGEPDIYEDMPADLRPEIFD